MGITKQYLRYVHEATFGVVGSINSDSVFIDYKKTRDRYIATAACESVIIWDSRTGNKVGLTYTFYYKTPNKYVILIPVYIFRS